MLLSWLTRLRPRLRGALPATASAIAAEPVSIAVVSPMENVSPGVPIYPPADGGLRVVRAPQLVATQHDLVDLLRRHVSQPKEDFEVRYLGPIQRLADYVGLLPATKSDYHAGAGGLFRFALELAVHSARQADGVLFAGSADVERKRPLEAAWRHAAFLTALCFELYRPLTEMRVVTEGGEVWSPYLAGLQEFAKQHGVEKVYVRWTGRESEPPGVRATAGYAVNTIVGNELLDRLHRVDPNIVHAIVGTVTGTMNVLDNHPLRRIVVEARAKVIERDAALKPSLYGKLTQGSHLEPFILDGIRSLIARGGDWAVNQKGSRLHYGKDGLYLAWPIGARELLAHLRAQKVDAIPSHESTLAEMLLTAGVLEPGAEGLPWHMAYPSTAEEKARSKILMVRFRNPSSILSGVLEGVTPVEWALTAGPLSRQPVEAQSGPSSGATTVAPGAAGFPAGSAAALADENGEIRGPSSEAGELTSTSVVGRDGSAAESEQGQAVQAPKRKRRSDSKASSAVAKQDEGASEVLADSPAGTPSPDAARPAVHSEPREPTKSGAIPERTEVEADVSSIPGEFIAQLGMPVINEVLRWREAWNKGRASGSFRWEEGGLAIASRFIFADLALDIPQLIEPLKNAQILHTAEEGSRTKTLHRIAFSPDKPEPGLILKRFFVERCGFIMN